MRAYIDFYNPDVVCLVETWLKGGEVVGFEGYDWFGTVDKWFKKNECRQSRLNERNVDVNANSHRSSREGYPRPLDVPNLFKSVLVLQRGE